MSLEVLSKLIPSVLHLQDHFCLEISERKYSVYLEVILLSLHINTIWLFILKPNRITCFNFLLLTTLAWSKLSDPLQAHLWAQKHEIKCWLSAALWGVLNRWYIGRETNRKTHEQWHNWQLLLFLLSVEVLVFKHGFFRSGRNFTGEVKNTNNLLLTASHVGTSKSSYFQERYICIHSV